MRILFLSLLLLTACMPAAIRRERAAVAKTIVVEDSLLQLTAYYLPNVNWAGKTILVLKNVSGQPLSIMPPKTYVDVWLTLKDSAGEEVVPGVKINFRDPPFKEEFKKLQPGEFLSFDWATSVSYYPGLPAGTYTASVSYHGTIRNANGGYIDSKQKITSAPVQVQIEAQPNW